MHIGVPVVATDSSVGLRVTQATRNTLAELFVADVFECRHDSAKSYLPQGLAGFFGTTADFCWGVGSDLAGFVAALVGMCVKMARFTVLGKCINHWPVSFPNGIHAATDVFTWRFDQSTYVVPA
jgi:hypothetical protein